MAEEVVAEWNNALDLAVGLAMAGIALNENIAINPERACELLKPPLHLADAIAYSQDDLERLTGLKPDDRQMAFKLLDSDGREVKFPLQLVSNTTYLNCRVEQR